MRRRIGLLYLNDLTSRCAWFELQVQRALPLWGLVPSGEGFASFEPPEVIVVVAPLSREELLERSRLWLESARHVIALRVDDYPSDDAELNEFIEEEWRALADSFEVPVELGVLATPDDAARALARAREIAGELSEPSASREIPPLRTLDPGPSFALHAPELVRLDACRLTTALAANLRLGSSGAVLEVGGKSIALGDPPAEVTLEEACFGRAAIPGGGVLERAKRGYFREGERELEAMGMWPLGFDGRHPVGWTGLRMHTEWLYAGPRGVCFLSCSDHDFPCGPAKKLHGYEDNDAVFSTLAPAGDAVLHCFGHDALVTSAVPLVWRRAGDIDVADFPRDLARAVFFVHDEDSPYDDLLSEEARDRAPAMALGPSKEARYALDLRAPTYRILGPEPHEGEVTRLEHVERGFAVFDSAHRRVRTARGVLFGGAGGHALVFADGVVSREDLATGERRTLGEALHAPTFAVPVPGTCNVLAVTVEGDRHWAKLW